MKKILTLVLLFAASNAFAAFECIVNVHRVLVYSNGLVNILHSGRGDYTVICNLKGNWKDVDTVTCAVWVSLLQNAQVNGKQVEFYYDGSGSCATLPTYGSSPAPVYIGLVS